MKNKEKYAKEILDIVCNGDDVAINKDTMELRVCDGNFDCKNCYFSRYNYPHNQGECIKNFVHWANSEYKEKKEFSEADKAYVRVMDKLNWFAKDKDGAVWGYVAKPFKDNIMWDVKRTSGDKPKFEEVSSYTSATFEPLSWKDEEPVHRNEILGTKNETKNAVVCR